MSDSLTPQALLAEVRSQLEGLLEAIRQAAEPTLATPALSDLPAPFTGRLLTVVSSTPPVTGDLAAEALRKALEALKLPVGSLVIQLHGLIPPAGYAPNRGDPLGGRGIALVAGTSDSTPEFALGFTAAGFEVLATGAPSSLPPTPVANDVTLSVTSPGSAVADLLWPPGHSPQVLVGQAPNVTVTLTRTAPLISSAEGVTVRADSVSLSASFSTVPPSVRLDIPRATLDLGLPLLTALLGSDVTVSGDVTLTADANGLCVDGGLSARIPVNASVPGITVSSVGLALAAGTGGAAMSCRASVEMTVNPPLPAKFDLAGVGVELPTFAGSGLLGLHGISLDPPTAVGADIDFGPISGGGYLAQLGPGSYGGVISVRLGSISVQAYGLLATQPELSLVVLLSVRFPPPGIQLSFGFSLNAVGGIVGINRRIDQDALTRAVLDGSVDALLLPPDPADNAPAIIQTLAAVFPVQSGSAIGGPLVEIGWGGRLVTATVGVIVEVGAGDARIAIVGRVRIALPDPDLPLVLLQATVAGDIDLAVPSVEIVATLNGSEIAGVKLSGDVYLLIRGGSDPAFVMSVGGFNPRYRPPAGTPALRRVSIDLCPLGLPSLVAQLYLAITSNTVQIGAQVAIAYEIDGCGVSGTVGFDAMAEWSPQGVFTFTAEIAASVAVQLFGHTLVGITLDLTLSGPGPWHAHGTASVSILFFSASLDFSVTWGGGQPSLKPAADVVADALRQAFAQASAWRAEPPAVATAVVLGSQATSEVQQGTAVHPLGGLVVRQTVVPLDLTIDRFLSEPVPTQHWSITGASLGPGRADGQVEMVQDEFAPGEYLTLPAEDQLSRPDYEPFDSGTSLTPPGGVEPAPSAAGSMSDGWDTYLITSIGAPAVPAGAPGSGVARDDAVGWAGTGISATGAESALAGADIHADSTLWAGEEPWTFAAEPAYLLADSNTLTANHALAPETYSLLAQRLTPGLQVVERWETAGA